MDSEANEYIIKYLAHSRGLMHSNYYDDFTLVYSL